MPNWAVSGQSPHAVACPRTRRFVPNGNRIPSRRVSPEALVLAAGPCHPSLAGSRIGSHRDEKLPTPQPPQTLNRRPKYRADNAIDKSTGCPWRSRHNIWHTLCSPFLMRSLLPGVAQHPWPESRKNVVTLQPSLGDPSGRRGSGTFFRGRIAAATPGAWAHEKMPDPGRSADPRRRLKRCKMFCDG